MHVFIFCWLHVLCSDFFGDQSQACWTNFTRCKCPSPRVTLYHFLPYTFCDPEDQNALNTYYNPGRKDNSGAVLDQRGEG